MVTGLRRLIGEDPRGECELHRTCSGYAGDEYCVARHGRDRIRSVFMRARDMVKSDWNVVQVSGLGRLVFGGARQDNRKAESAAMASVGTDSLL
jgi:hypothetical protein